MNERQPRVSLFRWSTVALALLLVVAAFTDRTAAYAGFHAVSAGAALLAAAAARGRFAAPFLAVFGAIDLYQALASTLDWFPKALFQYSPTDDLVHWCLGALLVAVGSAGMHSATDRKRSR